MDRDLEIGFKGTVVIGGGAAAAAGGLAVGGYIGVTGIGSAVVGGGGTTGVIATTTMEGALLLDGLGVGGAAIVFGAGARLTAAVITFGHGARHLAGTKLTQLQVETAIRNAILIEAGKNTLTQYQWIQIAGQWIQYRIHALPDGTIHVGTYVLVSGNLLNH